MKIFALYTNITLTKKPDWLDDFLKKYQPHGLHVTLIQPRFIKEDDSDEVKRKISQFFAQQTIDPMSVVFDEAMYNKDTSGAIMLYARNAKELMRLQKELCEILSEYSSYVDPATEEYEKNFRPHITIGDTIPNEQYQESLKILEEGYMCEGIIKEVVLAVVKNQTLEEITNPANKIIYKL
ncbi:2'-5' RNA ligase family protein [Candidatus Uhrbacteria bacterium]|nr:2'-5' RNA ligase family protein [Candidatus Uhrbacteria bacterium]